MNEVQKEFKPKDIRNPYAGIIFYLILIFGSFWFVFFFEGKKKSDLMIAIVPIIMGVLVSLNMIRHIFTNCIYIIMTDAGLIAKNHFKKELGNFKWSDITEIYVKKGSYNVKIKDINNNEIKINTAIGNTEELFNEIINRSTNVKKIDLTFIKGRYPGISIYEKDLESK